MKQDRTVRVRIIGRVQGVAFRAWTRDQAQALGLAGWVRNEDDGSVSASFTGPADAVAAMIEQLHRGPPAASVSAVEVEEVDDAAAAAFDGFQILP